jgi:hypothetical protein
MTLTRPGVRETVSNSTGVFRLETERVRVDADANATAHNRDARLLGRVDLRARAVGLGRHRSAT